MQSNNTYSVNNNTIANGIYNMKVHYKPITVRCKWLLTPVDDSLWLYGMINESSETPKFYTVSFKYLADNLLNNRLNITHAHIRQENCSEVYLFIIDNIELKENWSQIFS